MPQFSPDRRWWWNGAAWCPAVSPDGLWHFDGVSWTHPPKRRLAWPKWLIISATLWTLSLVFWLPAVILWIVHWNAYDESGTIFSCLAGLTALVSVAFGATLGLRKMWVQLSICFGIGSCALLCSSLLAMIIGLDQNDSAPGNGGVGGLVALTIPTVFALAIVLYAGAGFGRIWRKVGDNRQADVVRPPRHHTGDNR